MTMPVNWIQKLNESNSRKHKEQTIQQAVANRELGDKTAEIFLTAAWYAYNPFNTYNIRQIPTTQDITGTINPWQAFFNLMVDLQTGLSGNNALAAVDDMSKQFDSDQWNDLCRPTLLKDLRVGATIKTFNKFLPKGQKIPIFECQLATDSEKHQKKLVGDKFIQRKLDGVRAIVVIDASGVKITSRNGKPFNNFGHIVKQIEAIAGPLLAQDTSGIVLDGEVMSEDFQSLMKQAHRKTGADASDSKYHIFDIVNLPAFMSGKSAIKQDSRQNVLDSLKGTIMSQPNLVVEDYHRVNLNLTEGHNQMRRYAKTCVDEGFEGIMIKDAIAPYECRRTVHWLKWKPSITVDLAVTALEEGTGRNEGRLGALVCEGIEDGKHIKVNVGGGFSDKLRDEIWQASNSNIGMIVEVKADAVTQNEDGGYSLRFPRFVRFRGTVPGEKL